MRNNLMKIVWYGTASLRLETGNDVLWLDPFVPMKGSRVPIRPSDYAGMKNILITHGHLDHIGSLPSSVAAGDCLIHATATPYRTLVSRGASERNLRRISAGDVLRFGDVSVTVLKGRHVAYDAGVVIKTVLSPRMIRHAGMLGTLSRLNRECLENGETVAYLIEAEGKKILVLGSLSLDENEIYPVSPDVLVLPYQGSSKIRGISLSIAEKICPRAVFLDHFDDTFPPVSSTIGTGRIKKDLEALGIRVIVPSYKEPYEF